MLYVNHTMSAMGSVITCCLNESATPGRLVIVQKTSPKGCCTYGSGVFAPAGRGATGHPDRDRQRYRHTGDRHDARSQRVHHRQADQAQHVVAVQRERVIPAIPAETLEDGPVDRPLLHRRARATQGRTAQDEATQTASPVVRARCGRRWPHGWGAAARRC